MNKLQVQIVLVELLDELIGEAEIAIHNPDDLSGLHTQYRIDSEALRRAISDKLELLKHEERLMQT